MRRNANNCIITTEGPVSPRRTASQASRFGATFFIANLFLLTTVGSNGSDACDWPQILGPNRNGIAIGEKILNSLPENGLKKKWSHPVGEGYAGPTVSKDRVIIFHRQNSQQWAECLSLRDGSVIWKTELPAKYRSGGIDSDRGPKAVPLIHQDKVYLFDAAGELFCLSMDDGRLIWTRSTASDFRAPPGYFGFGSSPIAIGNSLIVNVGGNDAGVVAFDLDDGKTQWVASDQRASYSSPAAITLNDKEHLLLVTRLKFLVIDPSQGNIIYETEFGDRGPTVNAAIPVSANDQIFLTASYGIGARLLAPLATELKEIWSDRDNFESQYSTPLFYEGKLYGTSGREDRQNGSYRCIDFGSGKLNWTEENFPVGHSILVGRKIVVLDHTGNLHILEATPKKFARSYQTRLFDAPSRAIPAIANGNLLARSNFTQGKAELACFEIGETKND